MLRDFLTRLRAIGRRRQLSADLDDELAAHLALKQQRLESEGMSPEEAARQARLALGNPAVHKETLAEQWTFAAFESIWRDVAYGARLLLKDRVFTAVALLTLTLGIGANTAVFSLLNSLLWRSLPIRNPRELVRIRLTNLPPTDRAWVNGRAVTPKERSRVSWTLFQSIARQDLFQGAFGIAGQGSFVVDLAGEPHKLQVTTVTGGYFPVAGVEPAAGRLLEPADDIPGGSSDGWSAVISDSAWARLFQRSPAAIGARISIERVPFTIAGVAPRSFAGVNPGVGADLWIPLSSFEALFPKWKWRGNPGMGVVETMARLRSGVAFPQARDRLAALSVPLLREAKPPGVGGEDERHYLAMKLDMVPAASGYSFLTEAFGPALWTLLAAVGAVLFIAATNLTNLILARSTARRQEIATRLALGASAGRVRRQLLIESALLALAGTAAGILCAQWLAALLIRAAAGRDVPFQLDTSIDGNILAFAVTILGAVVLIAGCIPAWSAVRGAISEHTRQRTVSRMATSVRSGLIVVQIAVSLALLAGAGLLIASMRSVFREATGFDTAHTLFIEPDLFNAGVTRERMPLAYQSILDEARRLPGVSSAAWTMHPPLTGALEAFSIELPGRASVPPRERMVFSHQVTDGYFAAMGIPIVTGRDFPPRSAPGAKASIVSRNLAVKFFGSPEAAIGQRLKPGSLDWTEIIGVAGDAKFQDVREPDPPTVYTSYWDQRTTLGMTLVINHSGAAEPLATAVGTLARREAGRTPFTRITTLRENIAATLAIARLLTGLLTAFAAFALLISATGIVGLLSYTVQLKRRDIGVRIALGATPSAIAREIQRQGMLLAAAGLLLGAALSWPLRRVIEAHLYRITPADPVVWIAVSALVLACAVAASAIPARRAARLDPMSVLRME